MATLQKIVPNLWFDGQAEEAANFYVSIFKDSGIGRISHYGKAGQETHKQPVGSVLTVEFQIEGQNFLALNGGPDFKFNEAVSFIVMCDTQEEIDYYWEKLSAGGDEKAQVCGWLKDKFGVSWQVTPTIINEMLAEAVNEKTERVMQAIMQMKKLDIAKLREAYEGVSEEVPVV
jgi:predicted 3-demethylubiquinone-9 3-methyltransferase (glyoxalase superfamily)